MSAPVTTLSLHDDAHIIWNHGYRMGSVNSPYKHRRFRCACYAHIATEASHVPWSVFSRHSLPLLLLPARLPLISEPSLSPSFTVVQDVWERAAELLVDGKRAAYCLSIVPPPSLLAMKRVTERHHVPGPRVLTRDVCKAIQVWFETKSGGKEAEDGGKGGRRLCLSSRRDGVCGRSVDLFKHTSISSVERRASPSRRCLQRASTAAIELTHNGSNVSSVNIEGVQPQVDLAKVMFDHWRRGVSCLLLILIKHHGDPHEVE